MEKFDTSFTRQRHAIIVHAAMQGLRGFRNFFQDARSKFMPASIATLAVLRCDCPHDSLHVSNR
jgi:hypothetical protein